VVESIEDVLHVGSELSGSGQQLCDVCFEGRRDDVERVEWDPLLTTHARQSLQLIEQTSKRWKGLRLLGGFLTVGAGALMFLAWAGAHSAIVVVASLIGSGGLACVGISRLGAWWYHA
jgi:hypothetical protein